MDHESGELSGPVALYDFVYLDYDKVESYSAQLDPAGSLRETKVVKQTVHTAGSAGEVGIPKLASGAASDQTANSESVDRRYDPKLTNALNLFELLSQFGLIEAEPVKSEVALVRIDERRAFDHRRSRIEGHLGHRCRLHDR